MDTYNNQQLKILGCFGATLKELKDNYDLSDYTFKRIINTIEVSIKEEGDYEYIEQILEELNNLDYKDKIKLGRTLYYKLQIGDLIEFTENLNDFYEFDALKFIQDIANLTIEDYFTFDGYGNLKFIEEFEAAEYALDNIITWLECVEDLSDVEELNYTF